MAEGQRTKPGEQRSGASRNCGDGLLVSSINLQALPSRYRHWPRADRSKQRRQEAVLSRPGLSPLQRSVGLGRLSVDNRLPIAGSLPPKRKGALPPIPSLSTLWFPPGSPAPGVHGDITILLCCRTSDLAGELPACLSSVGPSLRRGCALSSGLLGGAQASREMELSRKIGVGPSSSAVVIGR